MTIKNTYMIENKNIALVLSGGGARGIAHIGVIEELIKRGYIINSITGTSMGAVIGAVYAMGKLDEFKKWMLSLDKMRVFNLLDFSFSSQGLVKGDKVLNKMKDFIEDTNIEDLSIPFACVAVDLINREEVLFTKGSVYEAIRASISIPTVLTPIKKAKKLLVDGGVLNNIPVKYAPRTENDILVAVNVNAKVPVITQNLSKKESIEKISLYKRKMHDFQLQIQKMVPNYKRETLNYFDVINKTIGLMTYTIAQNLLEKHPPDILINISKETCSTFDFYRAEELIEAGKIEAANALNTIKI